MYNSKSVNSNQPGVHERLEEIVQRHIVSRYQKPLRSHNIAAFDELVEKIRQQNDFSLILDSGCGTAMSTMILARQNPNCIVVGIDQSFKRLNKQLDGLTRPENCILLRANCEDFWRLCNKQGIHFDTHYILYPNPWPKKVHFQRRWHGHPVFPHLATLADKTIVRSNWKTYLDEFRQSWFILTRQHWEVRAFDVEKPLTLFEKKYSESGQILYELLVKPSHVLA